MFSLLNRGLSSACRLIYQTAVAYPIVSVAGVGTTALAAGLTWRYLLKDRGSPELSQLLVVLDAIGDRSRLIGGLCETRLRSRDRWGWGSLARPVALFFPEESERRLDRAVEQFRGQLSQYATSIESHQQVYSTQMKLRMEGGIVNQVPFLPAKKALIELHRGFSILRGERGLSWDQVEERYNHLAPLLDPTPLPDFRIFRRACRIIDDWSWLNRFEHKVGLFPVAALHHLLEVLPTGGKVAEEPRREWEELCEKISQARLAPSLFYRAMVMAICHSGKVKQDETAFRLGEVVTWLERSFQLPLLDQEDPSWQARVARDGVVSGDSKVSLGVFVAAVGGCRLYEMNEEGQLLIPWRNELALCRLVGCSSFTFRSVDSTGLSSRVVRTFAITSEEGKRWLKEEALIEALQGFVSKNSLPQTDLAQAVRVESNGKLIWITDSKTGAPFDPICVENFLIAISPNNSHRWMCESGVGATPVAVKLREELYSAFQSRPGQGPEAMTVKLWSHSERIVATIEGVKPEPRQVVEKLKIRAFPRWLGEKGLIATFTDSFLTQFDQEISVELSSSLPPSSINPTPLPTPPTPKRPRDSVFD